VEGTNHNRLIAWQANNHIAAYDSSVFGVFNAIDLSAAAMYFKGLKGRPSKKASDLFEHSTTVCLMSGGFKWPNAVAKSALTPALSHPMGEGESAAAG